MKMTKKEFIKKVQKPAIKKWEKGLAAKNKYKWFLGGGSTKCSFCSAFAKLDEYGTIDCCGICPLFDCVCAEEFDCIVDAECDFGLDDIKRPVFNRIFKRNAKKLLQRIKDIKYEDIEWSDV